MGVRRERGTVAYKSGTGTGPKNPDPVFKPRRNPASMPRKTSMHGYGGIAIRHEKLRAYDGCRVACSGTVSRKGFVDWTFGINTGDTSYIVENLVVNDHRVDHAWVH